MDMLWTSEEMRHEMKIEIILQEADLGIISLLLTVLIIAISWIYRGW